MSKMYKSGGTLDAAFIIFLNKQKLRLSYFLIKKKKKSAL